MMFKFVSSTIIVGIKILLAVDEYSLDDTIGLQIQPPIKSVGYQNDNQRKTAYFN